MEVSLSDLKAILCPEKAESFLTHAPCPNAGGLSIVVLDRGFVYVGSVVQEGEWLVIHEARNIRQWGTERGLGQLALEGPTKKTVLDECGTVRVNMRAVLHLLACNSSLKLWAR